MNRFAELKRRNVIRVGTAYVVIAWVAAQVARLALDTTDYNADTTRAAQPFAEEAVRLDRDFVLALAALVKIHAMIYWRGYDQSEQRQQAARAAMDRAIALAPDAVEVLAARSNYIYTFDEDCAAALDLLFRARAAKPGDAEINRRPGFTQRRLGQWDEASASFLRADQLDPGTHHSLLGTFETLYSIRDASRAKKLMPSAIRRFPASTSIINMAVWLPVWTDGDVAAARETHDTYSTARDSNYWLVSSGLSWYERDLEGVIAILQRPEVEALTESRATTLGERELRLARAYGLSGDPDRASDELDKVVEKLTPFDYSGRSYTIARQLNTLATARALRDETEQAVRLANEAMQLIPISADRVAGPKIHADSAFTLALAGERDEALEMIEELLVLPTGFHRWFLYLDPRWDFFRDDERFNVLIKPLNFDESIHAKNK